MSFEQHFMAQDDTTLLRNATSCHSEMNTNIKSSTPNPTRSIFFLSIFFDHVIDFETKFPTQILGNVKDLIYSGNFR